MENIITFFLLFGIVTIIGIFGYYIFKIYFIPKRVEELADMLRKGQLALVIKKLQSMLEENDRDPYIHFLLAEAYNRQKKYPQAILEYNQILKIGKFSPKVKEEIVRSRLGKIYLHQKKYDEAKKEFLILTKLDSGNADHFFQVGLLFKNAGFQEKALPYFRQAVQVNRNNPMTFHQIGMIEYNFGKIQDAKVAFSEAVKLNPSLYEAHYYLGLCLKNQKDYEWALKELDVAVNDPKIKEKAFFARGLCFMEKEQFAKAILEFEKGLDSCRKGSEMELNLRYFIGSSAENLRDFHTAISNWERIIQVNAKFKDVSEKLKQYEEFRTDDTIKDFMIASLGKFELIVREIVESMKLSIVNLDVVNDSEVHVLTSESETNWRNTKRYHQLIYVFRTTESISEHSLRKMYEEMRSKGANRGVCMTTSEFTSQAVAFCKTRPIELSDKKNMIKTLGRIIS